MSEAAAWLERSDWSKRSIPFGNLCVEADGWLYKVSMPFDGVHTEQWKWWSRIQGHPAILEPVSIHRRLRYTAIDWGFQPISAAVPANEETLLGYGLAIAEALHAVFKKVGKQRAGLFVKPIAKVTVFGDVKLGFAGVAPPAASAATLELLGHADESQLVSTVELALRQLLSDDPETLDTKLGAIARRCIGSSHGMRFTAFRPLLRAFRDATTRTRAPIARHEAKRREALEYGLGLANAHLDEAACRWFEEQARDLPTDRDFATIVPKIVELAHVRSDARRRSELAAVIVPVVVVPPPIAIAPLSKPELIERALRKRDFASALSDSEEWIAREPDEPRAHHIRGKALLSLGRLAHARAAFDRAWTLRPQMLEAMLLRGEVDRAIAKLRSTVGTALPMQLPLPQHLDELRDTLISGRIVDAITMLQRPVYDADETAQLLLGELLTTEQRHADALAVYTKLESHAANLGRARSLLALERAAESLAILESLIAERPDLDEALEVRARALLALHRGDEADAQHAAYMQAIARRSDRRVHSR